MRTTADAVIIGGGIQGVSALYHVAESGVRDIVLLEMHTIGSGTTAHTAAWVWQQVAPESSIWLSKISMNEFRSFADRYGVDIGFRQRGSLWIDTLPYADALFRQADLQETMGVPTDILTAGEIESLAPFLNVSDVAMGLYCSEDAVVDPHPFVQTYVKEARRLGAEVAEGVRATNVVARGGRVLGVETTDGYVATPIVVNAAGIYDKTVARWIGIDLPTENFRMHILLTEPTSLVSNAMPMIAISHPAEIFIEERANGAQLYIGHDPTDRFDHVPNLDKLVLDCGDALAYRMPAIADLGIAYCEAGIRSDSPDGRPILGPVDGLEGYINDCGWGGAGVAHAPGGGRLIAGCILGTSDAKVSVEPYLLQRFDSSGGAGTW